MAYPSHHIQEPGDASPLDPSTPGPKPVASKRASARRKGAIRIVGGLIAATLGFAAVSGVVVEVEAAETRSQARMTHGEVQAEVLETAQQGETDLSSLADPVEAARAVYSASVGHVLTEDSRLDLNAAILHADDQIAVARSGISIAIAAAAAKLPTEVSTAEIVATTTTLSGQQIDLAPVIADVGALLTTTSAAVTEAVGLWQLEQDRLAAEQAAALLAEQVAAQVAAQAAAEAQSQQEAAAAAAAAAKAAAPPGTTRQDTPAPSAGAPAAPVPAAPAPVAPQAHLETVWAAGFQTEIDACRGSVDLTARYGTAVIGEHWDCGGSSFPKAEGTLIELGGILSGRYRTGPVVAILDKQVATTDDVPRGYDLLYQTCIDNSNSRMSFTVLTRVD